VAKRVPAVLGDYEGKKDWRGTIVRRSVEARSSSVPCS
jgi:hypothetical protein